MSKTPFALGGYFGNPNGSDPGAEAAFAAQFASFSGLMGAAPQFLDYFVDQAKPVSGWAENAGWQAWSAAQSPAARNATPVIGLPLTSTASTASPDQQYRAFASGQYDDAIRGVVKAWAANGFATQYWRLGWEMNVASMPSYAGTDAQTKADWVAAFRHVSTVLHQAAAQAGVTVQVVWNPNATNYDTTGVIKDLYPGNAYVDVIGADMYANMWPYSLYDWHKNDGTVAASLDQWMADPVNRMHYWSYPAATQWSLDSSGGHNLSLQTLLDFAKAQGKPFAIPETGAGDGAGGHGVADDAAFPGWLAETLAAYTASGGKVAFVNIWDANADGNYDFSSAGANKPGEAAAWAKAFGTPAAGGQAQAGSGSTASQPTPDTLTLTVSEDAWQGDAQFTVSVDGHQVGGTLTATASRALGQTNAFSLQGSFGAGEHTVAVTFLNDAWGGPGLDRNLYVEGASFDGRSVPGGKLALFSSGTQSLVVGGSAATASAAVAAPTPVTAPTPVMIGSGKDALVLSMSEDAWQGDAQFTISIDGRQVGGTQTTTARHGAGQSQAFTVNTNLGTGQHRVDVAFLNDAWGGSDGTDRNLFLLGATLNGTSVARSSAALLSNGTASFSLAGGNGTAAPLTSSLVLNVSEDAWLGDAQFIVAVDGHQLGGVQTATASHAAGAKQAITFAGIPEDHLAHDVAVTFLNDAWAGPGQDRNLYVDSATFDGQAVPGAHLALFSGGTQHFSVTAPVDWAG